MRLSRTAFSATKPILNYLKSRILEVLVQMLYCVQMLYIILTAPLLFTHMSRVMRKPAFWFPTWSNTNRVVQLQKMARSLKFRIWKVEGLYYLCNENKGTDQLRGYREADLRLCFRICKTFVFHDTAHMVKTCFLVTVN